KLTDFGLAREVAAGPDTLTPTGALLGTPAYMSPEQIRSPSQVEGRSDVYSLGVVLYELLTGERPFRGATALEVCAQAVHDQPVPPRRLNRAVPRDLETITLACLEKEPRDRPLALDLAEELGRFLDARPIRLRPVSPVVRALRWCGR